MRGLENKRVLVTGAASGIGRATAERFMEEGSRVVGWDIDASGLKELQSEHPELAGTLQGDVADAAAVARGFEELDALLGGLDVLINNAGITRRAEFTEFPQDDWRVVMDVNLDGAFYVAQQAGRRMAAAGSGVILHTASTNGLVGYPRHTAYCVSKAGVVQMTRTMALDLAPEVRVNAVCPGFIATPILTYGDEIAQQVPMKRMGKPDEVGALFAFLASDDAAFITGQSFVIDGGELAGGLASTS